MKLGLRALTRFYTRGIRVRGGVDARFPYRVGARRLRAVRSVVAVEASSMMSVRIGERTKLDAGVRRGGGRAGSSGWESTPRR